MEKFMTTYVDPDTIDNDEDCQDYYKMMMDLKKANLTIKKETALALNEDTVVKNYRWSGLKKHAMKDDFESSQMWVSILICFAHLCFRTITATKIRCLLEG